MPVPGSERARERRALALASLLHAGALVALAALYHPAKPFGSSAASPLEVEVEADVPMPALASQIDLPPPPVAPAPAGRAHSPNGRSSAPLTAELDSESEVLSEPSPPDQEGPPTSPPDRVVDLGLGPDGWRKWASATPGDRTTASKRRGKRPTFRAPPASTTGGLQEGLEARDRELGLGASGPVIGALYRAAHSDVAPQLGTAHFRVVLHSSGAVEVSLTSASDQTAGWSAVAARAAEALRKTPQRIPADRAGVSMVIEVTAESVFPSGLKRKDLRGPHLDVTAPAIKSAKDAKAELENNNPLAEAGSTAIVDLPGVYLAETGKVCSYKLGLSVLGPTLTGGCDLANAGSKAQRLVHTRVTEESVF
jgi:hypothetical protein